MDNYRKLVLVGLIPLVLYATNFALAEVQRPTPDSSALVPKSTSDFEGVGTDGNLASKESLAKNRVNDGFVTLPSGLQYRVLRAGHGDKPGGSDVVTVHHRGWTPAGKEIGDTYAQGHPQNFPTNFAIPAWSEALQLMPVGAIWKLLVPADLAYGKKGWRGKVGPNEALVYELELVDIAVRGEEM